MNYRRKVTHLDIGNAIGQVGLQVFNSSNKTVHQFGIIPAALFDISGCKRIEM